MKPSNRFPLGGAAMAAAFAGLIVASSSGKSLLVTFLPAVPIAFAGFWLVSCRRGLNTARVLPVYLFAVAWQMLHFAEEYITGFYREFPRLIDGSAPYDINTFVAFNMFAYFMFLAAAVFAILGGVRTLLFPAWFFVIYGVWGNAIAHPTFALLDGGYFPGLYTSLAYWLIGPILLKRMLEPWPNEAGSPTTGGEERREY